MNISHKYNTIWLCPEGCSDDILSIILKDFGFLFETENINGVEHFLVDNSNKIPESFKKFKVIKSIRNPYDKVFNHYFNFFVKKRFVISKNNKNQIKNLFSDFLIKSKSKKIVFVLDSIELCLKKWNNFDYFENFLIKDENLIDDLSKIDFIINSLKWKSGFYQELIEKKLKNKKNYHFSEFYDKKNAKIVFEEGKREFFRYEYSPFSFSSIEMSENDKISFIHDFSY